jgi:hypothetical protein
LKKEKIFHCPNLFDLIKLSNETPFGLIWNFEVLNP